MKFIKTKQAAAILKKAPSTVKNWANQKKITAIRNPDNGFRAYIYEEIKALADKWY